MKHKTLLSILACAGLTMAAQANTVTFNSFGSGDLGSGAKTFTSGGIGLTITPSPGQDLYGKTSGGDETGLGLSGTAQNEITSSTYIALTVPTVPVSDLHLLFFGSVQTGEIANVYFSTTLGDTSPGAFLGQVVGADGSFDVSGHTSGYIMITGGGTGGANVLLDSVTATTIPDGGTTVALLGFALTALAVGRRKLVA